MFYTTYRFWCGVLLLLLGLIIWFVPDIAVHTIIIFLAISAVLVTAAFVLPERRSKEFKFKSFYGQENWDGQVAIEDASIMLAKNAETEERIYQDEHTKRRSLDSLQQYNENILAAAKARKSDRAIERAKMHKNMAHEMKTYSDKQDKDVRASNEKINETQEILSSFHQNQKTCCKVVETENSRKYLKSTTIRFLN